MKCDTCDGTGTGRTEKDWCSICDGTGFLCDICGEAAEAGADTCDDCLEERLD